MNELKDKIQKKIIKDKEASILEHNEKIDKVVHLENPAELFEIIVDIYYDKEEKENAIIELMRVTLQNEFFREADIFRERDELAFSNGEHTVTFSTLGLNIITIRYVAGSNPERTRQDNPVLTKEDEEYKRELLAKFQEFSKDKSFRNFKELSKIYNKDSKKGILSKYSKTFKDCNPRLEDTLKEELKNNEDRKNLNRYALEVYKVNEEKAIRFLNKLTDLETYKENDWNFILSNEAGKTTINKKDINFK